MRKPRRIVLLAVVLVMTSSAAACSEEPAAPGVSPTTMSSASSAAVTVSSPDPASNVWPGTSVYTDTSHGFTFQFDEPAIEFTEPAQSDQASDYQLLARDAAAAAADPRGAGFVTIAVEANLGGTATREELQSTANTNNVDEAASPAGERLHWTVEVVDGMPCLAFAGSLAKDDRGQRRTVRGHQFFTSDHSYRVVLMGPSKNAAKTEEQLGVIVDSFRPLGE